MTFFGTIQSIVTPTIKEMALTLAPMLPDYFWHCAASSSGKYHPEFDLGEGGTMRHSIMVALCAREMATAEGRTQEEIDLLVFCGLFHDGVKQGWDDAGYTVFNHPVLAAKLVLDMFPGNRSAVNFPYDLRLFGIDDH